MEGNSRILTSFDMWEVERQCGAYLIRSTSDDLPTALNDMSWEMTNVEIFVEAFNQGCDITIKHKHAAHSEDLSQHAAHMASLFKRIIQLVVRKFPHAMKQLMIICNNHVKDLHDYLDSILEPEPLFKLKFID